MERSSQVILRNASRLKPGSVLLVNPPRDHLCQLFEQEGRLVRASTQHFGDYRWLQASGVNVTFDVVPWPVAPDEVVVMTLPREKERLDMMLHSISAGMTPDSVLWLVGENQAGIKSAGRHLERHFNAVTKLDNARHCGLFEATGPQTDTPFDAAYGPLCDLPKAEPKQAGKRA